MKSQRLLLFIDAIINLVLGISLIIFPSSLIDFLGVPTAESAFYPSVFGAILFGIGVALLVERCVGGGLGCGGAISINLCGGIALGLWLMFGDLELPFRGVAFLWGLVVILVGISVFEIFASRRERTVG